MSKSIYSGLLASVLLIAACGTGEQEAEVRSEPAAQTAEAASGETDSSVEDSEEEGEAVTPDDSAGSGLPEGIEPQRVVLPLVPAITLPDLSILGESGSVIEDQLAETVSVSTGVDVVSAECGGDGQFAYSGSDDQGSFFDVQTDGSGIYVDQGGSADITIAVNADGSGTYANNSAATDVLINVNADGSGVYRDNSASTDVTVEVDSDGFGRYFDNSASTDLSIEINPDGSGLLVNNSAATDVWLEVRADGSGTFRDNTAATDVLIETTTTNAWSFTDNTAATDVQLFVNADGSGTYRDNSASTDIIIEVDADGNGFYSDQGASNDLVLTFTTELGILDPGLVVASPLPTFAVADRFPPLASLGRFEPPCVTIIRLDANVLFDFDSDVLRPEAGPVVDEVAQALSTTGKPIEVHGHTDSVGADDYNQDLSVRRAEAFASAIVERGVSAAITTTGFGETRPVASNEKDDGSDDPAGRQLNRRIEIVIPE